MEDHKDRIKEAKLPKWIKEYIVSLERKIERYEKRSLKTDVSDAYITYEAYGLFYKLI